MMGIAEIWYEPAAVWLMIGRGQQCTEHHAVGLPSPWQQHARTLWSPNLKLVLRCVASKCIPGLPWKTSIWQAVPKPPKKEIASALTLYQHKTDVWKKSSSDKQKESFLVWLVSTRFVDAFMCFGGPSLSLLFWTHPPSASHNHLAFIISPRLRVTGPSRRNYGSPFKSITSWVYPY